MCVCVCVCARVRARAYVCMFVRAENSFYGQDLALYKHYDYHFINIIYSCASNRY